MAVVIFAGFFYIIKMFTDYLLKRRIVKSGHFEKADILTQSNPSTDEPQRMTSLKWALVSTMAGLGLIVGFIVGKLYNIDSWQISKSIIFFGFELMFIGLGFLFYFLIANKQKH